MGAWGGLCAWVVLWGTAAEAPIAAEAEAKAVSFRRCGGDKGEVQGGEA